MSQFPTLASVVFHVSRQPAWPAQEVGPCTRKLAHRAQLSSLSAMPPALHVTPPVARRFVRRALGLAEPFPDVAAALTHLGYPPMGGRP